MIKKILVPAILLLGIALFQFATMPAFYYPGDNFAIRAEAANLVNTGELGIDYSQRETLGGFLAEKGQYFFENDKKGKFYSRYGVGNTLFYIAPYAIHKALHGPSTPSGSDRNLLFILNIYSLLFTVISGLLLYRMAGLITNKYSVRILYVLAVIYGSFFSHYFKHPVHENYQIALSLAFFYFALRFFLPKGDKPQWWNIGMASLFAGILLTMKSTFIFFYLALGLGILINEVCRPDQNTWPTLKRSVVKCVVWLGIPALIALAFLLIGNTIRFNSPFESGYEQWVRNDSVHYFSLSLMKKTIPGFLWEKGNANMFLHFPLLFLSIPGFVVLFKKIHFGAFWFLITAFLSYFLMLSVYASWRGEWCYGPRHLVFILAGVSIASVYFLDKVANLKPMPRGLALGIFVLVFGYAAWSTFQVNSIQCFAFYQVKSIFNQTKIPAVNAYFKEPATRGPIYRDIRLHATGKKSFPPIQEVRQIPNTEQACAQLDQIVKHFARPNYYFAPDKSE